MPSNYTPWGGPGPMDAQQRLYRQAQEKVKAIAGSIIRGEQKKMDRGPLWQNILFSWIYKVSYRHVCKMDKSFWVDDKCNSCGICSRVCPANNIQMIDEKPTWLHRCGQCFTCLQWCPQEAIQYGKKPSNTRSIITLELRWKTCSNKRKRIKDDPRDSSANASSKFFSLTSEKNMVKRISYRG
jgi:ferredoxin